MPNILADSIGSIRPLNDNTVLGQLLLFLRDQNGCDSVLDLPTCWVGIAQNYITDGPGYHGPVYIVLWSGSPKAITTVTCDEQGDFIIAANHGA